VLNAKRHQRLGQQWLARLSERFVQVLNAKRHQRLGQVARYLRKPINRLCSTPKGIKGWDSRVRAGMPVSCCVLNAKRHQRLGQQAVFLV